MYKLLNLAKNIEIYFTKIQLSLNIIKNLNYSKLKILNKIKKRVFIQDFNIQI